MIAKQYGLPAIIALIRSVRDSDPFTHHAASVTPELSSGSLSASLPRERQARQGGIQKVRKRASHRGKVRLERGRV